MSESTISRRSFVQSGMLLLLAGRSALASAVSIAPARTTGVEVTLEARTANLGRELVSFGLPLPPGFLSDTRNVRVVNHAGTEFKTAVRALEPWRIGGREGSIRSLLVQFTSDFSRERTQRIKVLFQPRRKNENSFVPVEETLIHKDGLAGPRVVALLPADWLCDSGIVGPQIPVSKSGQYHPYDQFVERNFPGSLEYLNSQQYSEWLFDRTSVYYKMYARTGDQKFLAAAYHAAHFVRLHTKSEGADAGIFTLKGPDLKYVYPRAMHIHYLLTGDERMRDLGKVMAQYCFRNQDPVYEPGSIKPSEIGTDPERGRKFWTLRHQGYGLLGILHGWELTGDRAYWVKARECVDAYYRHQQKPPDGRPSDGSLRQDWALYDPSEANFKGATSAWMMALLLDPLFHYWTLTNDHRVSEIVIKWCDFLDRQGMVPDGSKAYYVINCFHGSDPHEEPSTFGPDMEMHNPEISYTFALGAFFNRDPKREAVYRRRFDKLFPLAVGLNVNHPGRAFNWAFQFSSQLVYFMQHKAGVFREPATMLRKILFVIALAGSLFVMASAQTASIIIRPEASDEVLVNPGMGITTFQRFNGQPLNHGLHWSEEGPISKQLDAAGRSLFPDTSVAYCRWFWNELQPAADRTRWEIIDTALEEARQHHQTLAFRLMPYDEEHPLPEWFRNSGAHRANKATDKDGAIWQPDFSDPLYLKYWSSFVAQAGARYDGHPFLETVDISSVGYWGEGWSDYMPAFQFQKALIDIYFDAFKYTPLLMNFDEPPALAYGTERGAGWRLDCLGDMGRQWQDRPSFSHMLDFYPQQIARMGVQDVWRRSPVSLETCWVPGFWKEKGWDVDYILDQALRWHVTTLNVKSSPIPPEWQNKFEAFQKRIGYRFVLRRLDYPRSVMSGEMMPVHMWWLNAGVAPIYRQYTLALQFQAAGESHNAALNSDLTRWLPGDATVDQSVYVPDSLKPGIYQLRLAILDPRTNLPAVRLAIHGGDADGWYPLGAITVTSRAPQKQ